MNTSPEQRPSPVRQRLRRGIDGLLAPFRQVDDAPAAAFLAPEALALFRRMSAADRAHSLRVYAWLRSRGVAQRDLLTAGLLHDCGKAAANLAVWQRTLKVLLHKLAPGLWTKLSAPASPGHWRYPFYILADHARIGADWAEAAGCSELTCWLIANHESEIDFTHPRASWLQRLQDADASS